MQRDAFLTLTTRISFTLCVASFGLLFWNAHLFPSLGTDSLIYHLTIPAFWDQQGFLSTIDLPFHDSAAEHSPALAEWIYFFLLQWNRGDSLVWVVQPFFYLLMIRFFYLSARLLNNHRNSALLITALFLYFPPFLTNAQYANNDLVMTCGCAWFLYGILYSRIRPHAGTLHAITGLCLMVSTKYVAIIYLLAGLPLLFCVSNRLHLSTCSRNSLVLAGLFLSIIIAPPLFFYLKNTLLWNNPIYPAEIGIGTWSIGQFLYNPAVLINHSWSVENLSHMLLHAPEMEFGMHGSVGCLLWLGWVGTLISWILARHRKSWISYYVTAIFPLLSIILFFWKTPFWSEHRLLFPVYYGLCLGVALTIGNISRKQTFIGRSGVSWILLLVILIVFISTLHVRMNRSFLAGQLINESPEAIRNARYPSSYPGLADAWNLIQEQTADNPGVIAYSGSALIFPLFGNELQNSVHYIPISENDFPHQIHLIRGDNLYEKLATTRRNSFDKDYWIGQLKIQRVTHLILVDDPKRGGVAAEHQMIQSVPEHFHLLYEQKNVRVYQVLANSFGS